MRRKILVTGCAGFIGSNLCRSLVAKGYAVRGIDNLMAGTRANIPAGVEFFEGDIRDPRIEPWFEGVDAVFHLAARNCLSDCMEHPLETAAINVGGTVQVLEACRKARVRKFIYADTSAEYEGIAEMPCAEDRVAPIGTYAVSKRGGALFVESHAKLHGLGYTILRYFNVYGPAQDFRRVMPPVMSAFLLKMMAGEQPTIFGSGEKRRDFIYVDDVNRFHLLALSDPRTDGKTFNVGSGTSYSIREVFDACARALGVAIAPVFREDMPGEAEVTLADTTAARSLGFVPEVSLELGLSATIDYLRSVAT